MGLLGNQTQQQYYTDEAVYGNYQFTSLKDIINHFIISHVGEDKIISKVKRSDVIYHAKRAMQELSFDTFKSCKSMEMIIPASLQMALPQDYVNWTKISWSDSAGIKHRLYPTTCKSSNPFSPQQDSDGDFIFDVDGDLVSSGNFINNSALQGASGSANGGFILNRDITGGANLMVSQPIFLELPNLSEQQIKFATDAKIIKNSEQIDTIIDNLAKSGDRYALSDEFDLKDFTIIEKFNNCYYVK